MTKVSIIIPVYNGENSIVHTLDSLEQQDYDDFEVIIIDDCSQDRTYDLCQEYCRTHERFVCRRLPENRGVSAARNQGIALAGGDYCTFVDADDWVEEDLLSTQVQLLQTEQADVAFAGTIKENELRPLGKQPIGAVQIAVGKEALAYDFGHIRARTNPMFVTVLIQSLRYDETISSSEDILFDITALRLAKKAVYDPVCRYHYLIHEDSAMHRAQGRRYFESGWQAQQRIYEIIRQENLAEADRAQYYQDYCLSIFGMLRYAAKAGEKSLFADIQGKYSTELLNFLRTSGFDFNHRLKYKTYLLPYRLVQMLHGSNKQNVE